VDTDSDRIQLAQWILERNLAWIGAAEVKVGVIVAIDTAMLGALASVFGATQGRTMWAYVFTIAAAFTLGIAVICASRAVLPKLSGPQSSMIFFGRIAARVTGAEYVESFRTATTSKMLEDCLIQIHRNAQIASEKFMWVGHSMRWSFVALIPWVAAFTTLL
jgi:hypothetical protein